LPQTSAKKNFERITVDPEQMAGVPSVRHLRILVATEGIHECLGLAAASAMERELPLPHSG
jgi:hypothetical protein